MIESIILGRQFYKCQKPKENGGCNFFLWATPEEGNTNTSDNRQNNSWNNSQPASTSGWGSNNPNTNRNNSNINTSWGDASRNAGDSNDTSIPNCHCNLPSKKYKYN